MEVRLLQHIMENGRPKMTWVPDKPPLVFVAGAVIYVSKATGEKWIKQGVAEDASNTQ